MNKICISLEQSKKLIELGIDITTADMYYSYDYNIEEYDDDAQIIPQTELGQHFSLFPEDTPAWSLSALLNVLPRETRLLKSATDDTYHCDCPNGNTGKWFDNTVDACYELVLKLHELKML